MHSGIEHFATNPLPVSLEQSWPGPAARKTIYEVQQFKALKSKFPHLREVEIREAEVHYQAGWFATRVTVPAKHGSQFRHVFGSLERIKIVRVFSEPQAGRAKLLEPFAVANADPSPIVAL